MNPDTQTQSDNNIIQSDPEYSRAICACLTRGAEEIARLAEDEGVDQSTLLYLMTAQIHSRLRRVLQKDQLLALSEAERELLEHIIHFQSDQLSEDIRLLKGEFNGLKGAFLIDMKQKIGQGGINEVFYGIEIATGREICVRRVYSDSYQNTFLGQEGLSHAEKTQAVLRDLPLQENVVRFWGSATDDAGDRYTVFDFAEGENVDEYLDNPETTVTYRDFREIALGIARGLEHYHQHGLIHGDVKPDNFIVARPGNDSGNETGKNPGNMTGNLVGNESKRPMFAALTPNLKPHIIDMDIMRTEEDYIQDIISCNFAGSVAYGTPETQFSQIEIPASSEDRGKMAKAGDVHSLGLSFYNIVTGKLPPEIAENLHNPREAVEAKKSFLSFEYPEETPMELPMLIEEMCHPDWQRRPSMADVIAALEEMSESLLLDGALKRPTVVVTRGGQFITVREDAETERDIGEYIVVRSNFATKEIPEVGSVNLAILQDTKLKQDHVGIPYHFAKEAEAREFFDRKKEFFQRLNQARGENTDLFPGKFDLQLSQDATTGQYTVWVIRNKVKEQVLLDEYLAENKDELTAFDQLEILLRIARSLAVLEKIGYRHPDLSAESVFFAPPDHSYDKTGQTIINHPTFYLAGDDDGPPSGKIMFQKGPYRFPKDCFYYRLELMDTSMAVPIDTDDTDPNISEFIAIAAQVLDGQTIARVRDQFRRLIDKGLSWEERVELLTEMREAVTKSEC